MSTSSESEAKCAAVRKELKAWEKQFTADHDGRKAGREDIKANATIAAKYKEYNKLRDIVSGKIAPRTPSKASRKPKIEEEASQPAPTVSAYATITPSKKQCRNDSAHSSSAPGSATRSVSPQLPDVIGPTPQRDGIVLGLFDLLPSETPSKRSRAVLGDVAPNVLQTPSKKRQYSDDEGSVEARARGSRTPLSAGKRFLFDKFVTPKKRKRDEEGTPTSALKHLSTPAFLRRDNALGMIAEEDDATSRPAPFKRRPFGRSLSAMIRSMKEQEEEAKKQEDERLDEELEMMREMEMEAAGIPVPKKPKVPDILVQDSQAMPLGPDGAGETDAEAEVSGAEDGLDENGKPRKVWKKRGQKRQTKRVNMRPVFHKPKPQPGTLAPEDDSDGEEAVPETQAVQAGEESEDEFGDNTSISSDDSHTPKKRKVHEAKQAPRKATTEPKEDGTIKKAARKVKESAHANYRKLKIKSKGAKGGRGGKFGRRR